MILLQLSAGQGPLECSLAVGMALKRIEQDSVGHNVALTIVESVLADCSGCYKSVLMQLEGQAAEALARTWSGSMQWTQQSPYRPGHKRKNWFFSGKVYVVENLSSDKDITFQACRASGAGGQHVNTTDSAVRATHKATGISVRVESERSQHANKRLALALIHQKLEDLKEQRLAEQSKQRRQQHWELERGNPDARFKGMKFVRC